MNMETKPNFTAAAGGDRQPEATADGSYTLYVPQLDEHYHSVKGALTEAQHIFIDLGLKQTTAAHPRVLEIGLGTGLNAFLTLLAAEDTRRPVHYTGIERYPLREDHCNRSIIPDVSVGDMPPNMLLSMKFPGGKTYR